MYIYICLLQQRERYVNLFLDVVEKLKNEDVVLQTTTGPRIREVLEHIQKFKDSPTFVEMVAKLGSQVEHCLPTEECFPSRGRMWSTFHDFRVSDTAIDDWRKFMVRTVLNPQLLAHASNQCFQLVIDRVLKCMIETKKHKLSTNAPVIKLSVREENVIYYMSGFVAVKLMKKYQHPITNPELSSKCLYFVGVLREMKAEEQPLCDDTMVDYSRTWCEQIDRGGLYKVKSEVCFSVALLNLITIVMTNFTCTYRCTSYLQKWKWSLDATCVTTAYPLFRESISSPLCLRRY